MLLQNFEDIITRSQSQQHCLLVHKPILTPLLRLLQWCRKSAEERRFQLSSVDKYFVQLVSAGSYNDKNGHGLILNWSKLNQICMKMAEDSTLLHFFFIPKERRSPPSREADAEQQPFLVFSLLIPYLYSAGDIGQMARDAL